MNKNEILKNVDLYLDILEKNGVIAKRLSSLTKKDSLDKETMLAHVAWMCAMMYEMKDIGKMNRWLGFIQGILWNFGLYSIEDFKTHNMNI